MYSPEIGICIIELHNWIGIQTSRQELHEQFKSPVKSSRLVVTQSVGRSMKSPASVDNAGSKMKFRYN